LRFGIGVRAFNVFVESPKAGVTELSQ